MVATRSKLTTRSVLAAPADTDILPNDLPDTEVAAIVALGATGAKRPPADEHQHGGMHSAQSVSAADQAILDDEIAAARSVIAELDTIEKVAARGYVLATSPSPGIGTHWVRWSQILDHSRRLTRRCCCSITANLRPCLPAIHMPFNQPQSPLVLPVIQTCGIATQGSASRCLSG